MVFFIVKLMASGNDDSKYSNWARTLLMRVKFLMMMMWCGFGRGMNGECDQVKSMNGECDQVKSMNGECDQVKRREGLELEEFSWLDLPTEVARLIPLKLRYEDKAKLACVCKWWRDIIQTLTPIYLLGKSPMLIHVKSRGEEGGKGAIFHYYSPLLNQTFQVGFPFDLRGYEIISAPKNGTLLVYNQDEMQMRMVETSVGESIKFGRITSNISFNGTAIGSYDNFYVIFLIDTTDENQVTVHVYDKLGWTVNLVYDNQNVPFYLSSNPVYFDRRFYCLDSKSGRLGVFDLLECTWDVYSVEFMNKYDDDCIDCCCCCYYLVDWIDTVMAVRVKNYGSRIHLFVLDREKMVWKETHDLCGRSLFLGSTQSAMCLPTAKKLQNRVFLPHCHEEEPKTVIAARLVFRHKRFYFRPKSSKEQNHGATTICCCNNSGGESQYLGSTQNQKYCTIWFLPFY